MCQYDRMSRWQTHVSPGIQYSIHNTECTITIYKIRCKYTSTYSNSCQAICPWIHLLVIVSQLCPQICESNCQTKVSPSVSGSKKNQKTPRSMIQVTCTWHDLTMIQKSAGLGSSSPGKPSRNGRHGKFNPSPVRLFVAAGGRQHWHLWSLGQVDPWPKRWGKKEITSYELLENGGWMVSWWFYGSLMGLIGTSWGFHWEFS